MRGTKRIEGGNITWTRSGKDITQIPRVSAVVHLIRLSKQHRREGTHLTAGGPRRDYTPHYSSEKSSGRCERRLNAQAVQFNRRTRGGEEIGLNNSREVTASRIQTTTSGPRIETIQGRKGEVTYTPTSYTKIWPVSTSPRNMDWGNKIGGEYATKCKSVIWGILNSSPIFHEGTGEYCSISLRELGRIGRSLGKEKGRENREWLWWGKGSRMVSPGCSSGSVPVGEKRKEKTPKTKGRPWKYKKPPERIERVGINLRGRVRGC